MDKEKIFSHFKSVLDDMIIHSNMFKIFIQSPRYLETEIFGDGVHIPASVVLASGATRICVIDENYDYVVKFDYEEDARGSACEREERFYKKAEKEELNKYFSEVEYIGEYKAEFESYYPYEVEDYLNYEDEDFERDFLEFEEKFGIKKHTTIIIPLYAYRRADENPSYSRGYVTKEEETSLRASESPLSQRALEIAIEFFKCYGAEEFNRLSDFLVAMGVNDIHRGNIGFVCDGPVIIDYAGYFDSDDEEED